MKTCMWFLLVPLRSYLKRRDAHFNVGVGMGQHLIFICDHGLAEWEVSVLWNSLRCSEDTHVRNKAPRVLLQMTHIWHKYMWTFPVLWSRRVDDLDWNIGMQCIDVRHMISFVKNVLCFKLGGRRNDKDTYILILLNRTKPSVNFQRHLYHVYHY